MIVRELLTLLGFESNPAGAKEYEDRLKQTQKRAESTTNAMAAGWDKVGRAIDRGLDRADRGLGRVQGHVQVMADSLGGIAGALGGVLGFAAFSEITSRMTDFQSRLNNAAEGTAETGATLMAKLRASANTTYQAFDSVVDGFIAMSPALNELGLELGEQIDLSTAMADSLTVASVKGEQAARIMMWLNRSLSAGAMSGEAFANIMEADSDVLDKMRQSLGMSVAEFQEFGRAGKISARMVVDYYKNAAPELRRQSEAMTTTIADSMVIFRNNFDAFIHGTSEATGAANAFAKAILWFAERPAILGTAALGALATGFLAMGLQALSTTLTVARGAISMIKWLRALRAAQIAAALTNPWLLLAGAIVAVGLAVQDVYTWMNGGDSVVGRWLGPWSDFAARIAAEWSQAWVDLKQGFANIGQAFSDLMSWMGGIAGAVGDWFAPLLGPVTSAMTWLFGDGGTLHNAILAAFPAAIVLALWRKLWDALPETVRSKVTGMFEPLTSAWGVAVDFLREKWNGFWDSVSGGIASVGNRIGNWFEGALAEGQQYGTRMGPGGVPMAPGAPAQANPSIPQYARGTPSAATGVALVGEEGPELVRFRGGEQVVPADRTRGFLDRLAARASDFATGAQAFLNNAVAPALDRSFGPIMAEPMMAAMAPAGPTMGFPGSRGAGPSFRIGTVNAPTTVNIEKGAIPPGVSEERVAELLADRVDSTVDRRLRSEFAAALSHFADPEE